MTKQLLLYPDRSPDQYRWCWLDDDRQPILDSATHGDLERLASILGEGHHNVWLLVPGNKVVTREIEYSDSERKHLQRLLPFQLEETVVGDIDQFHFALGPAQDGRAAVAYVEKPWLRDIFAQLEPFNIEITRCSVVSLLLPLAPDTPEAQDAETEEYPHWTLHLQDGQVLVRYAPSLGYSIDQARARMSLEMLLTAQQRVDKLPHLDLRASTDAELATLEALLPSDLADRVDRRTLVDFWQLDYQAPDINLCQGEFSQRLPVERWWKDWRSVVAGAAACLVVYIGVMVYQVQTLEAENVAVRQEIEQVFRSAMGPGRMTNPEIQLRQAVSEVQPASATGRQVTPFLADLLPALEADGTTIRSIAYAANSGEINLSVQASAFSSIEALRERIVERGLQAELLSASAQGDVHSARLRIRQQRL
ncbi:type II secretion system protein GspL [Marinimicrobium sp. ABcell2]|uniref:type II secretion system protein GspL n=1 Tax=Marinimicrobium sp. ABcell2 TaxID=3069751 RepID=UPI0027B26AB2|nr:type II secretion system protein GspL [Marinimicrobium sp. ABcell2]MDQ2076655.1 type II secretion system protein GspL [Marinimicrobium sp. ABcell2]